MTDEERNGLLLDVILAALKGFVETNCAGKDDDSEDARRSGTINFSYLLGQSIRQWQVSIDNWHTSRSAMEVWHLLGGVVEHGVMVVDIKREKIPCGYKEQFICKQPKIEKIPRFEGTNKKYGSIKNLLISAGAPYVFNNIFIAEHTTPVSDIKDALVACYRILKEEGQLKELRSQVLNILGKIHITQMLKIEDRRINNNSSRVKEIEKNKKAIDSIKKELSAAKRKEKKLVSTNDEKLVIDLRYKEEQDRQIKTVLYYYLYNEESNKVFDDLCKVCYRDLNPAKQNADLKKMQRNDYDDVKLYVEKKKISWAEAVLLNDNFNIEIYPKNNESL